MTLTVTIPQTECLITKTELASKLDLHPNTIDNLVKRGDIEVYKIGNSVRFDLSAVMDSIKKKNEYRGANK